MSTFDQDIAGIGALADPVRRALYLFVSDQADPVTRDRAADALGIARHQAKFHLDRLEAEGLLETGFARVTGRSGPGAGRTSKLYHRAPRDIAVSLPDREYELAGRMMADAIAESTRTGVPVNATLAAAAAAHGRAMAEQTAPAEQTGSAERGDKTDKAAQQDEAEQPDETADALDLAQRVLRRNGYEPRREDDQVVMANCPFHALAQQHTELVCGMNHAMLTAMTDALAPNRLRARLAPGENRCCVVLESLDQPPVGRRGVGSP